MLELFDEGASSFSRFFVSLLTFLRPLFDRFDSQYFIIPGSLLSKPSPSASSSANGGEEPLQPDRLARACDPCYTSVFEPPPPASRFLSSHPTDDSEILRHPTTASSSRPPTRTNTLLPPSLPPAEHRLSRILAPQTPNSPLFDFEISSPPFEPFERPPTSGLAKEIGREGVGEEVSASGAAATVRRGRKVSAVRQLRRVLER